MWLSSAIVLTLAPVPFLFNAYSALLLPFVLQGVLAGSWLWWRGRRQELLADQLLGVLLLLLSLLVAQWFLGFAGWYDSHDGYSTFMFYVPWDNGLAVGPLLFFYFRALTDQSFRLTGRTLLHLAPAFVAAALLLVAAVVDLVPPTPLPYHFGTKGAMAESIGHLTPVFGLLTYLSLAWYGSRTLRAYTTYGQYLDDHFSDTEQLRFGWVRRVLLVVLATALVWLGFWVVELAGVSLAFTQQWFAYLVTGLLIYYLSFAGLQTDGAGRPALLFQAQLPTAPLPIEMTVADASSAPDVIHSSHIPVISDSPIPLLAPEPALIDAEVAHWLPILQQLMLTEKPWLEPELTLADLANRLRITSPLLSKVINSGAGQNFNDFVNTYRVQAAEQKLTDPRFAHYTLLAVAIESGFNSKSTFNRAFRKLLGQTPSEVGRRKS